MSQKRVIIPEHIDESGIKILGASDLAEVVYFDDEAVSAEDYTEALRDAAAVLVRIKAFDREMMRQAPRLEIISKHGVGVDNIDMETATERKIPVTITATANSDAVADHAMGMMLSLSRNLSKADADLKSGTFTRREHYTGFELGGKTVGIIGLGRIGSRVAKRCAQGFGMQAIAYDPFIDSDVAERRHAKLCGDLRQLLKTADYVTVHTPLTTLTKDMIGEKELRSMKPDAVILNTARGGIINESALYNALKNGWIRGAGLDAYVKEPPLPHENPLLELDNILVTPHIAGHTQEAAAKMATHAAEEILRVFKGDRPMYPINPEIYE